MWGPDFNRKIVLVRAPVEDVARALATAGVRWEKDVLGRRVVLGKRAALVFRLRGHEWTGVVSALLREWPPIDSDWKEAISARLRTSVSDYYLGDTAGVRGYTLYRKGEKQEELSAEDGKVVRFSSKLRKVRAAEIKDADGFIDEFFRTQDAVDAGITFNYFRRTDVSYEGEWKPGQARRIQSLGFPLVVGARSLAITRPPIERVELLTMPKGRE